MTFAPVTGRTRQKQGTWTRRQLRRKRNEEQQARAPRPSNSDRRRTREVADNLGHTLRVR